MITEVIGIGPFLFRTGPICSCKVLPAVSGSIKANAEPVTLMKAKVINGKAFQPIVKEKYQIITTYGCKNYLCKI